ncbi:MULTISPECIES: YdiU family protein [unclassified Vibrio]|uniref:Protein nucleotidyltransferase YdiU n=1 Tax=Vibrio sp. HB236076 TaxID=3232307 RepID=A0AB39H7N6_9VIBR|nr:YdiU family protein [Vibrio sp. HB161653]MDP5253841.1 YdiU family protein [Vibrio sp. HB161653]
MSIWQTAKRVEHYRLLDPALYSFVPTTALSAPKLVKWNNSLGKALGLSDDGDTQEQFVLQVSNGECGDELPPLAMKYTGHQFGVYNPELGDGRGVLFAELIAPDGKVWDLHLKGSGQTPYSRMGDGRAVLRSTLREYLASEALHALGIPTTRALALVTSNTPVQRERVEKAAQLIRATPCHIRFGHFEYLFYTEQHEELQELADWVIARYYPECQESQNPYQTLFFSVLKNTAKMIAYWQAYGFNHGVMNTDNMSIIGETFDFGPYAFLDSYQPSFVCNHSDYQGRYAFNQQPRVALWNLSALANAFSPLVDREALHDILSRFDPLLSREFSVLMRAKLGLIERQEGDSQLFSTLFELLNQNQIDYTLFFRLLSNLDSIDEQTLVDEFIDRESARQWLSLYTARCQQECSADGQRLSAEQRCAAMRRVNPKYILRTYLAEQAIQQAEQGDFSFFEQLNRVLAQPFDEHPQDQELAKRPPDWASSITLSCSS